MSTLQEILNNLDENAPMSLEEIITEEVSDWERSDDRELMLIGQKYYRVKNDVLKRVRQTIDENGRLIAIKNLADNRIPNGFIRKLVDQKTGYLLSRPFMAETKNKDYQNLLDGYFDKGFKRMLKNIGTDAINCGKAWLQVYYNENGGLSFLRLPPEECIPLWKDAAHTELDAFIRVYEVEEYVAKTKTTVKKVQFWNTQGVQFYEYQEGMLTLIGQQGHFSLVEETDGKIVETAMNWERLPFICFKYNDVEQPLIDLIKQQVDDYDNRKSDNANNLEDLPNSLYVVKNFSGTGAAEFRKNISTYRVVFVDGEGDLKTVSLDIDTEAYKNHMDQARRDIYEFGRGVDTQSDKFGNSPSGIALRFLYSDLDLDANDIEIEFQAALEQMLWFMDQHIVNTLKVDYSNEPVEFIFNRDILINETEAVTNAKDSVGIISRKTIVANHPWVTNTQDELEQMEKEKQEDMLDYPELGGRGGKVDDPIKKDNQEN